MWLGYFQAFCFVERFYIPESLLGYGNILNYFSCFSNQKLKNKKTTKKYTWAH